MANLSAVQLRESAKKIPHSNSPRPLSSQRNEDERKISSCFGTLFISALNKPLSPGAALSASSISSVPASRKLAASPSTEPTNKAMPPSSPSRPIHLLIASLGNPAPYLNTRHSAGHILLKSLILSASAPTLHKSREYGGPVSSTINYSGGSWTFFQSPTLMNVSGPAILKALKAFHATYPPRSNEYEIGLVILHDELELECGQVKIKRGDGSAKGHNGIKSVQQSLQGGGILPGLGSRFVKIGVGIGRPVSREKDDVSGYVLGQLSTSEKGKIEDAAQEVQELLEREIEKIGK